MASGILAAAGWWTTAVLRCLLVGSDPLAEAGLEQLQRQPAEALGDGTPTLWHCPLATNLDCRLLVRRLRGDLRGRDIPVINHGEQGLERYGSHLGHTGFSG